MADVDLHPVSRALGSGVLVLGVRRDEAVDDAGERLARRLAGADVCSEGHGGLHRGEVVTIEVVRGQGVPEPLRQPVPAPDELGGVLELDLARLGKLALERLGDEALVDLEDEDLVVGEEVFLDGLAEAQPVQDGAIEALVIHRDEHGIRGGRLLLDLRVEEPGCGRHVEALRGLDVTVVMDPDEL